MSAEAEPRPTPESIASYVKQNTRKVERASPMMMKAHHGTGQEIVRKAEYKGHHIVVRTTYQIEVDGRPVGGHLMLTNDGQLHTHGMPNMSFDSPIELVKTLIDHFPQDFEGEGGGHEGSHPPSRQ